MSHVGWLPVLDGETTVGVVSDRDILVRASVGGLDPHERLSTK
jgi:hypothetical protein